MAIALFGALAIGLSLGLLGSGGSILTVPVLVLIMHRPEKIAIVESLAIVGSVALIGAVPYAMRGLIHWRTVLLFGLSGIAGSYTGACFSPYISGSMQLAIFAAIMLPAAWMMVRGREIGEQTKTVRHPDWLILLEGFAVGSLTGCIGVGGGFIIVPTLVLLLRLPIYFAIGTSLLIIAMNSFTGFAKQSLTLYQLDMQVDWLLIAIFSAMGIFGSMAGSYLAKAIPQLYLRRIVGLMMFPLSLYILFKQFGP